MRQWWYPKSRLLCLFAPSLRRPNVQMATTVSSLLHREKEWLAEEVIKLSTRLNGLEVREPTCAAPSPQHLASTYSVLHRPNPPSRVAPRVATGFSRDYQVEAEL